MRNESGMRWQDGKELTYSAGSASYCTFAMQMQLRPQGQSYRWEGLLKCSLVALRTISMSRGTCGRARTFHDTVPACHSSLLESLLKATGVIPIEPGQGLQLLSRCQISIIGRECICRSDCGETWRFEVVFPTERRHRSHRAGTGGPVDRGRKLQPQLLVTSAISQISLIGLFDHAYIFPFRLKFR